jgi:hypothetical protein
MAHASLDVRPWEYHHIWLMAKLLFLSRERETSSSRLPHLLLADDATGGQICGAKPPQAGCCTRNQSN